MAMTTATTGASSKLLPEPLHMEVVTGNLKFVSQPLLLGHYDSLALTGTKITMDTLLGGTMDKVLGIGATPQH